MCARADDSQCPSGREVSACSRSCCKSIDVDVAVERRDSRYCERSRRVDVPARGYARTYRRRRVNGRYNEQQ